MKKLYLSFSIVSLVFFICLFVYLGVMIRFTRNQNLKTLREDFTQMKTEAVSAYLAAQRFESEFFKSRIENIFTLNRRLQLISISSEEEGILYLYTRSISYFENEPDIQTFTGNNLRFKVFPLSETILRLPFAPVPKKDLVIESIFIVLGREDLYPIFRNAFFMLLVFLLVVGIFFLITTTIDFSRTKREKPESAFAGALPERQIASALQKSVENAINEDRDLVFSLVRIDEFPSLLDNDKVYGAIADLISSKYLFDLQLFQWQDDGFALVLPGFDLDVAIGKSEELRKEIESSPLESQNVSVSVGLCSLNNRRIDPKTLIREAHTAVEKAANEGMNQVIAFRADPDRFRTLHTTG